MGSRLTPTLFHVFFFFPSSRHEFDSEQIPDLTRDVFRQDIHSVGSLCKLYFRELPNPLLTYQLYDRFSVRTGAVELGQGFVPGINVGMETGIAVKHCEEKKLQRTDVLLLGDNQQSRGNNVKIFQLIFKCFALSFLGTAGGERAKTE